MKHKKIILFFILVLGFVVANIVIAAETGNKLKFIPSMTIPGFYTAGSPFYVEPDTLPRYIVAIYRYGGMFVGVVAMFMLVYAGWEWLLAGGNSSKISSAKSKISATLVALVILFGGYLLLSLISQRLVAFNSLDTSLPALKCSMFDREKDCPEEDCHWIELASERGFCVDGTAKPTCTAKEDQPSCEQFSDLCKWEGGKCGIQEKCDISQEEAELFVLESSNSSFNMHCCASNRFSGGFSSYRYAIFGDRTYNNSCTWVCGAESSPERPMDECKTELGWSIEPEGGW